MLCWKVIATTWKVIAAAWKVNIRSLLSIQIQTQLPVVWTNSTQLSVVCLTNWKLYILLPLICTFQLLLNNLQSTNFAEMSKNYVNVMEIPLIARSLLAQLIRSWIIIYGFNKVFQVDFLIFSSETSYGVPHTIFEMDSDSEKSSDLTVTLGNTREHSV